MWAEFGTPRLVSPCSRALTSDMYNRRRAFPGLIVFPRRPQHLWRYCPVNKLPGRNEAGRKAEVGSSRRPIFTTRYKHFRPARRGSASKHALCSSPAATVAAQGPSASWPQAAPFLAIFCRQTAPCALGELPRTKLDFCSLVGLLSRGLPEGGVLGIMKA